MVSIVLFIIIISVLGIMMLKYLFQRNDKYLSGGWFRRNSVYFVYALTALASYFYGFGWARLLYFWAFLIHSIIFLCCNFFYSKHSSEMPVYTKVLNKIICVTYVVFNMFFPDCSDVDSYIFFGLIKNDNYAMDVLSNLWVYAIYINIILLIWQTGYVFVKKIIRKK